MIGNQTLGPSTFGQANDVLGASVPTIASASTIAPLAHVSRVTGAVTISTITQPHPYFNGPLFLFNTDASVGVTDTNGNIALATTLTRYKIFAFIYDAATGLWYPSAVS